jgi:hypothetical protein
MNPDRRRTPRIRPEGLAYINFEPDNGGIVLDISEDGLCFQSVAPVRPDDVIRLWFSAEGNPIAVEGRLAWIDEKRKTGGLQFNDLSVQARQQIHDWITQSPIPFAAEKKRATATSSVVPPVPLPDVLTKLNAASVAAFGQAAWNKVSERLKTGIRRTEFFRGLAAGLLVSVFVVAVFLFHMQRRQVGELLIRMGEGLGARTKQDALRSIPVQGPAQERSAVSARASNIAPRAKNPPLQPATKLVGLPPSKSETRGSNSAVPPISSAQPLPMGTRALGLPTEFELGTSQPPESTPSPGSEAKFVEPKSPDSSVENSEVVAEVNSGIPLGKYFEVGRFRDQLLAREKIEDLARASFDAIVVPKNLLWMTSYQVLVGPYRDEEKARIARKGLQSRGFNARSLPRRSREFDLPSAGKLHGGEDISEGFVVTWEAYSAEATVQFVRKSDTVTSGKGRWVKQANKFESDGVMYDRNEDGSRRLLEIWFRGMKQALVFPTDPRNHPIIF